MKRTALDRNLAKQNPERVFGSPLEIVSETLLTKGEKLGTLDRWRQGILDELRANAEGMRTQGSHRCGRVSLARLKRPSVISIIRAPDNCPRPVLSGRQH